MSEWKTVSVRQELIKEIEKIIRIGQYRSISEFISEAIRLRLEELSHAEAPPTERYQESLTKEDTIARTSLNLEKEKVQSPQPMPSETSHSQTRIETIGAERDTSNSEMAYESVSINPNSSSGH